MDLEQSLSSSNCGVAPIDRAAYALLQHPEKSDRAIAEEIGVGKDTVRRARTTGARAPVDKRVGREQELLRKLYSDAGVGSKDWEQFRMTILVRCADDLERSIKDFTAANDKLSTRVFWLNVILTALTAVGTAFTVWSVLKPSGH